jgi:demethylmenaquinone methyltransferase/2-methoxy-6-polyprenyl-1,4-benzoquinol methylase
MQNHRSATGAATDADTATYYDRRAAYYERVYFKPERQTDLRAMEAWLSQPFEGRDVLEVACGTGWWTPHGARLCRSWLATDLNASTMALAQSKPLPPGKVSFSEVDAFNLPQALAAHHAGRRFNAAFAGCWWSHLTLERLPGWLAMLHSVLEPGSRVVFLDNSFVQTSNLPIHRRDAAGNTYQLRTLDDGTTHEVVKNFPTRDEVAALLARFGVQGNALRWTDYTHYWVLDYNLP